MDLIDSLLNIATLILMFAAIAFMFIVVAMLRNNPDEKLVEENRKLREQLETLRELLKAKEAEYREELESVVKHSKMLRELHKAIKAAAIQVKCPEHGTDISILNDGTILCSSGHRIWPREDKEVEGHG